MRNVMMRCAWMGLILLFASRAMADAKQDARNSISTTYAKMALAMQHWDIPTWTSYLHADYVDIDIDGSEKIHGKGGVKKALGPIWARHAKMTLSTKIQDLTLDKSGAIVTVKQDYIYSRVKDGQPFTVESLTTCRDYWVKVGNQWLQKRSRTISEAQTINGQPVPHADKPN